MRFLNLGKQNNVWIETFCIDSLSWILERQIDYIPCEGILPVRLRSQKQELDGIEYYDRPPKAI